MECENYFSKKKGKREQKKKKKKKKYVGLIRAVSIVTMNDILQYFCGFCPFCLLTTRKKKIWFLQNKERGYDAEKSIIKIRMKDNNKLKSKNFLEQKVFFFL